MLKRQESSLSTSRRTAAAAATPTSSECHHATGIGCMSGIFQLFSRYQNSNKRLTFGRKQEKRKPPTPRKGKRSSAKEEAEKEKLDAKELNCEVKTPRSPMLQPEVRRSHAASSREDSRTTSSSLLMRLIGLEDFEAAAANREEPDEDSVAEKRKQLLQALEKCNKDLEALKRIINAVQKGDVRLQPHPGMRTDRRLSGDRNAISSEEKPYVEKCADVLAKEPNIPADTTEELSRSPIRRFSPAENATADEVAMPATPQHPKPAKKPGEDDEPSLLLIRQQQAVVPRRLSSHAMVESVEEVCRDIAWGEKRETGVIGLAVQDYLWQELIQELVHELNKSRTFNHQYSIPLQACKRRLCF